MGDAQVSIFNRTDELIANTVSKSNGSFVLEGDCNPGDYTLIVAKNEFGDGEKIFATATAKDGVGYNLKLSQKQAESTVR